MASERVNRKQADERKASRTSVFPFHDINKSLYLLTVPSLINLEIHLLNWVFASLFLFDQIHKMNRIDWTYEIAMCGTTFEATGNLSKKFMSYLVFFPIFLISFLCREVGLQALSLF